MECQDCQRLRDESHVLRGVIDRLELQLLRAQTESAQSAFAVVAYEQTIEQLRQDKAALECNRDLRMDRPSGFEATFVGE